MGHGHSISRPGRCPIRLQAVRKGLAHFISFFDHLGRAFSAVRGVMQVGKTSICDPAIIEDAGYDLGFNCSVVPALGISRSIGGGKPDSKRAFVFQEFRAVGDVLVPDPVNPSFEDCRERPPPDGKDENDALIALKPCDL